MAIFSKNGCVNRCYHGHRNVYLLCMRRRSHALLFINEVGGSRHAWFIHSICRHIQLSVCLWNQGVRIIEVLRWKCVYWAAFLVTVNSYSVTMATMYHTDHIKYNSRALILWVVYNSSFSALGREYALTNLSLLRPSWWTRPQQGQNASWLVTF